MKRLAALVLLALAACANPPPKVAEVPAAQPSLAREETGSNPSDASPMSITCWSTSPSG